MGAKRQWILAFQATLNIVKNDLTPVISGFNDVSWHNPDMITPNMEELAKKGVILESAYMQSLCTPSRAALLTGYYPIHTGRQVRVIPIVCCHDVNCSCGHKLLYELNTFELFELGHRRGS